MAGPRPGNASFCGARRANLPGSEMRDVPSLWEARGFLLILAPTSPAVGTAGTGDAG